MIEENYLPEQFIEDLEYLIDEGLVYKTFDPEANEWCYGLTDKGSLLTDYQFNHCN
jgi:hypothetical protein